LRNRVIPKKEEYQMDLTPRETQIVRMMARGLTGTQMAEELGTSRRTVEFHRAPC
jgi:DNA-binding NarL/FixJ family response regulator